jgi:hypothetical protein
MARQFKSQRGFASYSRWFQEDKRRAASPEIRLMVPTALQRASPSGDVGQNLRRSREVGASADSCFVLQLGNPSSYISSIH